MPRAQPVALPQRLLCVVVLTFAVAVFPRPALGQETSGQDFSEVFAKLPPKYQSWVRSVLGLITEQEFAYFLSLTQDYRRDAFMEAFWQPRDPEPRTTVNELYERWDDYRRQAGGIPAGDPRFLLYLFNGSPGGWTLPNGQGVTRCFSASKELEIWFYDGSERLDQRFVVIFQRRSQGTPYEVYLPGQDLRPTQRPGGLPVQDVRQLCAEELLNYAVYEIRRTSGYDRILDQALKPPAPPLEWLSSFTSSSADLPEGAETFDLKAEVTFPARKQSRTAVQVLLVVPREEAPGRVFPEAGEGSPRVFYDFRLVGEVIRDGRLFETFDYRFEGPTPEDAAAIPMGFTRYLRSGPATLRILVEDVYGKRYAQVVREVDVPSTSGLPAVELPAEAAAAEGPALTLVTPSEAALAGKVRFRAVARAELEKVTFYLDGEPRLSKRSPPYSVEIDLGEAVVPHRLRVVGLAGGKEVATDQIWLNQGTRRFVVRIVEPRADAIYPGSVTVRAEVQTPDDSAPQKVELHVDGELVATLQEGPYAGHLSLPEAGPSVIRAVAYLADGSWAEDTVVVNGSAFTQTVEVRLVEVPVVVTGRDGRPVEGLTRDAFRLFENGVEQPVERFSETRQAPLRAAVLIDRSASMAPHLERVLEAVRGFLGAALDGDADDRVALFSFAGQMTVDAGFTASAGELERPLAGLAARGSTALYDSLAQALNELADAEGQPALLVFSDGQDESSRLGFEEVLATARRAGVTVHALGLAASFPDAEARRPLMELAAETGGRAVFVEEVGELDGVYAEVLAELRSRYVLAYTPAEGGSGYRELRVEVDAEGVRVRARRGTTIP